MREVIAQWREKQAQFRKEEERVREHLASRGGRSNTGGECRSRPTGASSQLAAAAENRPDHLGRAITAAPLHEVWLTTAQLLLGQAQNRPCRQMLHEAHFAAVQLGDVELQAQSLLQLARLAFVEGQYGQAVKCAREAQSLYAGDEAFWCESSLLIADALANDRQLRHGRKMARSELLAALRVFRILTSQRPNKAGLLNICAGRVEARLGELQAESALDAQGPKPGLRDVTERTLLSAASKLQAAVLRLLSEGAQRPAAQVCRRLAGIYEELSERQTDPQRWHASLVEAIGAAERAVEISETALRDALALTSLQDVSGPLCGVPPTS